MFRFQQGMTDFCGGMLANVDFSRGSQITVGEGVQDCVGLVRIMVRVVSYHGASQ